MNLIAISLEQIDEDFEQPRNNYNDESLLQLVQSIKEVGLLTPIKVSKLDNGRFKIIFGHRRFKAHKILNLPSISAIVSENESEQDIFIQQLTENIQRDAFTPIEEAEAFQKALENSSWNISIRYLANTLGKQEKYISDKLSLLNFGTTIKNIIHGGTNIVQNQLTEQQVLPLKNLPIEYRDRVAIKVAREEITVGDVKKITNLFSNKSISDINKEAFLNYDKSKLIDIWADYNLEQKRKQKEADQPPIKPTIVTDTYTEPLMNTMVDTLPIEEIVRQLIIKIPTAYEIPLDIISTYKDMKIATREEFLYSVDCLIENLERHLKQWKSIKEILKKDVIERIK